MQLELPTSQYIDEDVSDSKLVSDVKNALKLSIEGSCDGYNELITIVNHDPTHLRRAMMSHDPTHRRRGIEEVAVLVTCLKALSSAASCIHDVHHRSLIDSIFGMRLWNYPTDVMDALVELILSLASSCKQLDRCLRMLVHNFCPPSSFTKRNGPSGLKLKNQVLDRVHSTLNDIADLVPLSLMELGKIVVEQLPDSFSNVDTEFMLMYVENMLRLEKGALGEVVGETMLKGVVDVLVSLDLAIEIPERKRDMKFGESEEIWDDVEHDEIDEMMESRIPNKSGRKEIVMKLDNLLVLTFEHLEVCYKSHRLTQVFNILLQAFEKTVFTAYKPQYAQFVMFYACSLDPINCGEKFATILLKKFIDGDMDLPKRISAVAYLASYLSRAKFMSEPFVVTMLESLAKWCSDYCKSLDGEINPEVHQVFYAGCQAIMYLLCFRMRSMGLNLKSQLSRLNLQEILMHPLSPLKVCMAPIVNEFLHGVRETQLFDVPETQEAFGGVDRLDTFFPFDPCWLSKASSLIKPKYMFWVESTPPDDEEIDCSRDDGVAEIRGDGAIDIVGGGRSFEAHSSDDEYGDAFDKMSITPKEYLLHKSATRNFHMQMPSKIRPSTSPESL